MIGNQSLGERLAEWRLPPIAAIRLARGDPFMPEFRASPGRPRPIEGVEQRAERRDEPAAF
jgi:hypothetical protein